MQLAQGLLCLSQVSAISLRQVTGCWRLAMHFSFPSIVVSHERSLRLEEG